VMDALFISFVCCECVLSTSVTMKDPCMLIGSEPGK